MVPQLQLNHDASDMPVFSAACWTKRESAFLDTQPHHKLGRRSAFHCDLIFSTRLTGAQQRKSFAWQTIAPFHRLLRVSLPLVVQ
jgi:hypothetical protein